MEIAKDEDRKHRRLEIVRSVRKGLIRYLYVILDLSRGMSAKDWKPHRCAVAIETLQDFVKEYLDQNPISQIGILGMKGHESVKLSDLSGNPKVHLEQLGKATTVTTEPSLQNALEMAKTSLKLTPTYGSREILFVCGSLTTADPGDIMSTVAALKKENIRVSFIGFGAEMYLLQRIAEATNGSYTVALDKQHLKVTLTGFTIPCPLAVSNSIKHSSLIQMGFPERKRGVMSLCMCHQAFTTSGYYCPRCRSKYCDLPTTCTVCNLSLVSSPHLARSYHHLFPVDVFHKVENPVAENCTGCLRSLADKTTYECPKCHECFCSECDLYIHDALHNCIGCLTAGR